MEENIKDSDFKKFSKLVYEKSGINLTDKKKALLQAHIRKLMRKRRIENFKQYFKLIEDDKTGKELLEFINRISTNVTSFFRELAHFNFIRDIWIDEWRGNNAYLDANLRKINIWSAGCSKGAEPYSIGITLLDNLSPNEYRNINILATDISTKVIEIAKTGIYSYKEVEGVSKPLLRKYFFKGKNNYNGYVKVKEDLKSIVQFEYLNLMDNFHFSREKFDIIFCRNTMIYFDTSTKEMLVEKFYNSLQPNGYLFTGYSESLNVVNHNFKRKLPAI